MAKPTLFKSYTSKGFLWMFGMILLFILALVFIWLWYEVEIAALDKLYHSPPARSVQK